MSRKLTCTVQVLQRKVLVGLTYRQQIYTLLHYADLTIPCLQCCWFYLFIFLISNRLYTEDYFLKEMAVDGIPEMQRSNLVSCVIQVFKLFSLFSKKKI